MPTYTVPGFRLIYFIQLQSDQIAEDRTSCQEKSSTAVDDMRIQKVFFRGRSATLTTFLFLVDGERGSKYHKKRAIIGPQAKRHLIGSSAKRH